MLLSHLPIILGTQVAPALRPTSMKGPAASYPSRQVFTELLQPSLCCSESSSKESASVVLSTLSHNAREVFRLIADQQLEVAGEAGGPPTGVKSLGRGSTALQG